MPPSTHQPPDEAAAQPPSSDPHRARKRPKIRRTTFACARCHRRKIKCDGLKPACSNCVQAKQPCNGILDGESKTVIPRSIAQYLQEKIREKELLLRKLGVDTDQDALTLPAASPPLNLNDTLPADRDTLPPRFDLASETARSFSTGLSKQLLVARARFPSGTFLFASSHLPSVTPASADPESRCDYFRAKSANASNPLDQIPPDVTERLVRNYVERISPLYPYYDRTELWARYHRVAGPDNQASDHDVFVVSMMIAISIMTSKFSDSAKIALSSERIFQHALGHSDALYESSFHSLQGTLLLIQYSYLMPRAASLWDIVGLAMRMALELGLHRDPEELPGHTLTEPEMELRRCVFWVLYIFDRSICATSHRRLGIADESISTKYPSGLDGTYFLHNIHFRRIQSELWTVNYLRRGVPLLKDEGSYERWAEAVEQRMWNWRNGVTTKKSSSPEWYDIAVWHGFVFLHRPCPRNPFPCAKALVKCFEAATEVAAGYWENAHSGFLKYSWHAVHHGFEAAIAMLYAIRHCKEELKERYGTRKILETVHLFSSLFVLMSERWSQAHASLESYERCKAIVMRELMRPGAAPPLNENDELDRMLLPQQAQAEKLDRAKKEGERIKSESSTPASGTPLSDQPPRLQRKRSYIQQQQLEEEALNAITAPAKPLTILSGTPMPFLQHRASYGAESAVAKGPTQPPPLRKRSSMSAVPSVPSLQTAWPGPSVPQMSHPLRQPPQQPQQQAPPPPPPPQQQQQQQQQALFHANRMPVTEEHGLFRGYEMWNVSGQAAAAAAATTPNLNMDWDELVAQPGQTGVDGMMLWSM